MSRFLSQKIAFEPITIRFLSWVISTSIFATVGIYLSFLSAGLFFADWGAFLLSNMGFGAFIGLSDPGSFYLTVVAIILTGAVLNLPLLMAPSSYIVGISALFAFAPTLLCFLSECKSDEQLGFPLLWQFVNWTIFPLVAGVRLIFAQNSFVRLMLVGITATFLVGLISVLVSSGNF